MKVVRVALVSLACCSYPLVDSADVVSVNERDRCGADPTLEARIDVVGAEIVLRLPSGSGVLHETARFLAADCAEAPLREAFEDYYCDDAPLRFVGPTGDVGYVDVVGNRERLAGLLLAQEWASKVVPLSCQQTELAHSILPAPVSAFERTVGVGRASVHYAEAVSRCGAIEQFLASGGHLPSSESGWRRLERASDGCWLAESVAMAETLLASQGPARERLERALAGRETSGSLGPDWLDGAFAPEACASGDPYVAGSVWASCDAVQQRDLMQQFAESVFSGLGATSIRRYDEAATWEITVDSVDGPVLMVVRESDVHPVGTWRTDLPENSIVVLDLAVSSDRLASLCFLVTRDIGALRGEGDVLETASGNVVEVRSGPDIECASRFDTEDGCLVTGRATWVTRNVYSAERSTLFSDFTCHFTTSVAPSGTYWQLSRCDVN